MGDREVIGSKAQFWLSVAILELEQRNMAGAKVAAKRALQLAPDWAKTHLCLANILALQNSLHKANLHYQKAIALDSSCVRAYLHLGDILIKLRKL